MIPCIISQRLTRWEKPNMNPYQWLLGAPAKLPSSTQLCSHSCPLVQPLPPQLFLPQPRLLPRKAGQHLLPEVARYTKIPEWGLSLGLHGRTTLSNLPHKTAVRLYRGKSESAETLPLYLLFSEDGLCTSMVGCMLVSVMWHPLLFRVLFTRWSQCCGVTVKFAACTFDCLASVSWSQILKVNHGFLEKCSINFKCKLLKCTTSNSYFLINKYSVHDALVTLLNIYL